MADWTDYDYVWFEGWNKRQVLRVDQTTGAGANYELKINVTWTEDYRSDFKDLRLTYLNGTDLKWWIEQLADGSFCALWLKVPVDLDSISFECFWWSQNPIADTYYNSSATDVFKRVISSGVVLALPMDEGTGTTVIDYSGNGNDGTLGAGGNAPSWATTGRFGNGLTFDGTADRVTVDDDASLDVTAVGIMVWATNGDNPAGDARAFMRREGAYSLRYTALGVLNGIVWVGAVAKVSNDVSDWDAGDTNNWIFTYDNANLNVYKNGVAACAAKAQAGNIDGGSTTLGIGYSPLITYFYKGTLSYMLVLDRAFTGDEINDLGVNGYYPQVSASNLGSLFLRTYVSGGVSYGFIVMEDTSNMDYIYLVGLLGVIGVSLVLFKLKLGVVGLVWGIFGIAIAASMAGNQAVPFYPYLTLGVAVIGTLLVLYSGYEMRGAS